MTVHSDGHSDEQRWLERYRERGDVEDLGRLYRPYMTLVYGLCLKTLQDSGAAEDAVMNIFEELTVKLRQHEVTNFKSWLYTLARNHCLMKLRKEKKDPTENYDPAFMHLLEKNHPDSEQDDPRNRALQQCLQQLTGQQRRCIDLFYYQGMSYKDIAEQDQQAVGTIRSYIQNGRRNLKNCIEKK